jgi:hypothetical protein
MREDEAKSSGFLQAEGTFANENGFDRRSDPITEPVR